jgi:hypothetical protein
MGIESSKVRCSHPRRAPLQLDLRALKDEAEAVLNVLSHCGV